MRLVKKIFNKVLFAVVVGVVFALFNHCKVKAAVLGTDLVYGTDYDIYQIPVDSLDDTWQLVGRTMTTNSNAYKPYNFLINRNNKSIFGVALPDAEYLNVIEFYDFEFENYAVFSSTTLDPKIILSSGMLPVFGGNCSSGSYCYSFINSGSQGDGKSATIYSDTIYIDNLNLNGLNRFTSGVYNSNGVLTDFIFYPWGKKMSCTNDVTGCYVKTGTPSSQWGFSSQNNLNSVYFTSATLKNKSQYEPVNQIVAEREEPVVTAPTAEFTDNYVKVNGLNVADNVLVKIINYDFSYKYYYQFTDIPDNYNENNFTELYQDNFMLLEDGATTTLHTDSNGYLIIKIAKDGEDTIYKSHPIDEISKKRPDITYSINYNSSNGVIIDEIPINLNYNIYASDTSDYKCYYYFKVDDSDPVEWTETECKAGRLYVARSNGDLLGRIEYHLGQEDQFVYGITIPVDKYGMLVSEVYNVDNNGVFGDLLGGTNGYLGIYTSNRGPLYSLVSLPLKLGIFVYQFFTSNNVCTPYDMGTIFNQHIVIGCVDLSILGTPLLTTIDIIFTGFFTITWGLFLYKLLRKIVILKDLSVVGVFRGGIF